MIESLALAIAVLAVLGGVFVAATAVTGAYRLTRVVPTLALVELALLVQAVLDVVGLARGHRPGEPAVHLAYVITSVLVLPAAVSQAHDDDARWSGLLMAVALVVVAVLVVRMQTTWRAA